MNINSTNHLSARPFTRKMLAKKTLNVILAPDLFKPLPSSRPNATIPPIINPPYPSLEKPIIHKPPVIIRPSINNPPLR